LGGVICGASLSEFLSLSCGKRVRIAKYQYEFRKWHGAPVPNTYGGKAVVEWEGEPLFAELAALRLFQDAGWCGAWVDTYRRVYRIGLPGLTKPVKLPSEKEQLIKSIQDATGKRGGCWDVILWKKSQTLFVELKRRGKDKIQVAQLDWLEAALRAGLSTENFALMEWDLST
jgi:hypothetical protein